MTSKNNCLKIPIRKSEDVTRKIKWHIWKDMHWFIKHLAENWSLRNEKVAAVPQVTPVNYENIHTWKSPMVHWPKDNDLQNTKIEQHQQGELGSSGRVISSCSTSGTRPCYFHQMSNDKSWTRKGWEFNTTHVATK